MICGGMPHIYICVHISRKLIRQVTIEHLLLKLTKKNQEKMNHLYMDSVSRKDALLAIFAEQFKMVKVHMFYFNVSSDQLPQNFPHSFNFVTHFRK